MKRRSSVQKKPSRKQTFHMTDDRGGWFGKQVDCEASAHVRSPSFQIEFHRSPVPARSCYSKVTRPTGLKLQCLSYTLLVDGKCSVYSDNGNHLFFLIKFAENGP